MDREKAHASIELGRKLIELHPELNDWVKNKVPEIKEYEDEIIRKEIIQFLQLPHPQFVGKRRHEEWIAWLENYKKENTDDKPKPKFKVGDWCIDNEDGTIFQIMKVLDNTYTYKTTEGKEYSCSHYSLEIDAKLWTIEDAIDGDTLTYYLDNGKVLIMIYQCLSESFDGQVYFHALLDGDYFSDSVGGAFCKFMEHLTPSTKEQHDLLYKKMKEKGYYFDEDEKILKVINKDKDETEVPVEDNNIKDELIKFLNNYINAHGCTEMSKWVSWIEKQEKKNNLLNFDEAEKEKNDFVSGQFIECRKSFNEFKELESYWLEYVGDDTYIGRSDNILNQKFHITPRQLFTLFTHEHCKKYYENQVEQKPIDKVEPKFKVGDWIMKQYVSTPFNVVGIDDNTYILKCVDGNTYKESIEFTNNQYHLWTIKDAKEYDILYYSDDCMVMVKVTDSYGDFFNSYCQVDEGKFTKYSCKWSGKHFKPATENQRNLFIEYMKKAGLDYDSNTKELKKIKVPQ